MRLLPFLPGKIIFGRSNVKEVALERLSLLNIYCKVIYLYKQNANSKNIKFFFIRKKLIAVKESISKSALVLKFFELTNDDILHATTPNLEKK
jgi:hypothetical protein